MYFSKCTLFLFLFLFSFSLQLDAQILPKISFTNIDKTHGLPSNNINAISKDNFGFMWFATNDGLCRYENSNRMQVLIADKKIKGGLKSSNISSIYIDKSNNIWIGTMLGGLSIYNQVEDTWETFINNPNDPTSISSSEILDIIEDSKGHIWIGTENGLNLYNPENKTFSRFKIDKNDPTALRTKAVLTIMEDDKGWIWVGTWDGGLHLMLPPKDGNVANSTFRNFNPTEKLHSLNVWKIYQDQQKRYWLGTQGDGLYLMQLPENANNSTVKQDWAPSFHNYLYKEENSKGITSNLLRDIVQDSKNRIWIGTVHGLSLINADQLPGNEFLKVTDKKPEIEFEQLLYSSIGINSIAHNHISSVYEDNQGIIWIGTFSGVSKYNWLNNQFENYKFFPDDFNAPNTQNLYISTEKIGWLATGIYGVLEYNFETNETKMINENNSDMLFDNSTKVIYSPNNEDIYFGSNNGVSCYNKKTGQTKKYPVTAKIKEISVNFVIHSLFVDNFKRIWIGTERGLFWVDTETGEYHSLFHNPDDKTTISDNSISDIYEDTKGYLWIATYNGLNRLKLGPSNDFQFTSYKSNIGVDEKSIPSNRLTSLMQVNDTLYIGTIIGLCGYDYNTDSFINFSKSENKYCVQSLEKTPQGDLWASSTEGIFQFITSTHAFNIFEKGDGLRDIAFRGGSSFVDDNGFIYFGNRKGVTRWHPDKIVRNETPPPVYITQVKKINKDGEEVMNLAKKNEICISHNNYYLSIDFSAVNYDRIEKNKYAYKLEGFEENWNYTSSNMSAVYTNLKHGEYTFRVKAANNAGVWNEIGASLKIIKTPAFWETLWFRILTFIGICSFILLAFSLYTKNVRKRNEVLNSHNSQLNKQIKERKRAEDALKEREEFLRLIMDNIPQHIYWIDKDYRFLGYNTSFAKKLEQNVEGEIIGKELREVFNTAIENTQIEKTEHEVLESGEPVLNQVLKIRCPNSNKDVWMSKNYIPLNDEEDEVIGVLVTGEDITSRMKADEVLKTNSKELEAQVLLRTQELALKNEEIQTLLQSIEARNEELEEIVRQRTEELNEFNIELQESNSDLGQFAYIASHDMKEPLRIIGNFAGLLSRKYKGKLDKSADEYIFFIEDGIKRMSALMDSLLTYSQVGKKEIELSKTNLNNILFAKLHDLSQVIEERNVDIQLGDLPEIYCERDQIGMVFFNLINNGIKFNKSERPIIKIESHDDAPEGFWKFSVSDNGIGILPEFQSQIFEIFRRLHSKQEYGGSGIGLALTQKIVLRHGGTIKVVSIPAEGTTFIFTIAKPMIDENEKVQETVVRMNESQNS